MDQTWTQRWFPKSARPSVEHSPAVTVALLLASPRCRPFRGQPACFSHTRWPASGREEGDTCGWNGCTGKLQLTNPDPSAEDYGCSCHIAPPCNFCMGVRPNCPDCGWAMEAP